LDAWGPEGLTWPAYPTRLASSRRNTRSFATLADVERHHVAAFDEHAEARRSSRRPSWIAS